MTKEIEKALQNKQVPPSPSAPLPVETQDRNVLESKAPGSNVEAPEATPPSNTSSESQSGLREFWVALLSDLEPAHDRLEIFSGGKPDEKQPPEEPKSEIQPQQTGAVQTTTSVPKNENDPERWFKYLPWILGGILVLGGLAIWFKNKFSRGEDDFGGGGGQYPPPKTPPEPTTEEQKYDGDYYKHVLEALYSK